MKEFEVNASRLPSQSQLLGVGASASVYKVCVVDSTPPPPPLITSGG